jgi:hypothetical protein
LKATHIYQTRGIYNACENDSLFYKEIITALGKYLMFDWGDICKEDKRLNDTALRTGGGRLVAKYITSKGNVFIITETDRTITTILFAEEY